MILGILIVIEGISRKIALNTEICSYYYYCGQLACQFVNFVSVKIVLCTCAICKKHQPNILSIYNIYISPVKGTRNKKETHSNWISCNSCKSCVHPKCSGLIKKENTKIEKLIKEKKINYYFKCIKCCFKSIITNGILQTEELSSLLSNIELDFTKTLLSLTTPIKTTVQSENSVNNNTSNTKN